MNTPLPVEFRLAHGPHVLVGDRLTPARVRASAVVLHGGGQSTGQGFQALRTFLHAHDVESISFDFVGHGRTGGDQLGTTLRQRVDQVEPVLRWSGLPPSRMAVLGFSMGAYVGLHVAHGLGIPRLCLAIPAAYAPEAFDVPFGPDFSRILRQPRSWDASDAFERIASYTGHLLVLSAGSDEVVPAEIPQRYVALAARARSRLHHVVAGAAHRLDPHYAAYPQARRDAYEAIVRLCLQAPA